MNLITRNWTDISRKVQAGGIAGGLTVAAVAFVNYYAPGVGTELSPVIAAGLTWAIGVATAYMARDRAS